MRFYLTGRQALDLDGYFRTYNLTILQLRTGTYLSKRAPHVRHARWFDFNNGLDEMGWRGGSVPHGRKLVNRTHNKHR
jgi:hypothetical protein